MTRKKDSPQKAALRELMGNYLKENNVKVKDVESASKLLSKKDENQSVQMEMINKRGEIIRIII